LLPPLRGQILRLNCDCPKFYFWLGLHPRPRWGSLQCSPRPIAGFKGSTSKKREGKGREEKRRGEKVKEGREGWKGIEEKGWEGETGGSVHFHYLLLSNLSTA